MLYVLMALTLVALYAKYALGNGSLVGVLLWMQCLFAPYYLPALYYHNRYASLEAGTELEVDTRHGLIQFARRQEGVNMLFHVSQIRQCRLACNLLLPHQIDVLTLSLDGGYEIQLSSLVVDPYAFTGRFGLPVEMHRRLFGPVDLGKALVRGAEDCCEPHRHPTQATP
ncbi:MAG: hypothetical protein OHK0039_16620 [Bacteroidia bacterium]